MTADTLSPELRHYGTARMGEYLDATIKYGSATKAAKILKVHPRTVQRALASLQRRAIEAGAVDITPDSPAILFLDIETAPILAFVWRMFQEVRDIEALIEDWYMLSWSAKWYGNDEIITKSLRMYEGYSPGTENDKALVEDLAKLLNAADFVVAHNGDGFDLKKIKSRMLFHGLKPCTPYRSIDTLKMSRRIFGNTSNKLDWLAWLLFRERKLQHDGLLLWKNVLQGDADAWTVMEEYNARDVYLLERIYLKLRPWDHLHPNVNLAVEGEDALELTCTTCSSTNVQPTSKVVTVGRKGTYVGYECRDCGNQMRGSANMRSTAQTQATLVSV